MTWATIRRAGGGAVMVAAIGYVAWRILGDSEARDALDSVPPIALAALVLLQALYLVPQAYRYLLALRRASNQPIPMAGWFRLFVLGRFLNSLLPQGGTVYRGLRLREDYGIPVARYLGGFVAFTWLSTLLNLVAASAVIAVLEPGLAIGEVPALAAILPALVLASIGPIAVHWLIGRLRLEHGFWGWAYRRLTELLDSTATVARSPGTLGRFISVGAVGLTIAIAMFWVAFDALDLDASLSTVVVFFVLLQLSTYINVTPGNLGVLELGFGALGSQLGIGLVGGLLVAALIRLSGYVALLGAGLFFGGASALGRVRAYQSDHAD